MHISSRNRTIVWGILGMAILVNIAGYVWDLYDRFEWFDEILHGFTTFALTLPLALLLYDVTLKGAQTRPVLEVQFAAAMPCRRWLDGYFWLRRQAAHSRIRKVEMGVFRDYGHVFHLTRPEDLDEELEDLLHEAYMLGCET